jgi:hypothetical protein
LGHASYTAVFPEGSVKDRKDFRDLGAVWMTPLQYWRVLTKALKHSVRPSGPRERLLRRCRKEAAEQRRDEPHAMDKS